MVLLATVRSDFTQIFHQLTASRPYLYMYAHSNELEEVGVVSLTGVNVESDPHKEALLGVSAYLLNKMILDTMHTETILIHPLHRIQLPRACGTKPQGTTGLGGEIRSHPLNLMTLLMTFVWFDLFSSLLLTTIVI